MQPDQLSALECLRDLTAALSDILTTTIAFALSARERDSRNKFQSDVFSTDRIVEP
jgi:hypothetical protein